MNIQGLAPQTVQSKVPFVSDILTPDKQLFFGLSETRLKNHKKLNSKLKDTRSSDVTPRARRNHAKEDFQEVLHFMFVTILQ